MSDPWAGWRGIDLRHLVYFRAVVQTLHFGRAAALLHISQPPLSIAIRQLEERLGLRLLERGRAGVSLTPPGRALADELESLLPRFPQAFERVQAAGRGEAGHLRVGFVTPAEYSFLPECLREFRALAPGVRLTLREMTSDAQAEALADGSLDAGFVLPPLPRGTLQWLPVFRDTLVAALPARHPLAARRRIRPAELAASPLVIFPREKAPGLHDDILGLFTAAGASPDIWQEAIQMQTILSLVAAGLGVAVVPASLRNLGRVGVEYRPLTGDVPVVDIALAWRGPVPGAALARFIEHVSGQSPALAQAWVAAPRRGRGRAIVGRRS